MKWRLYRLIGRLIRAHQLYGRAWERRTHTRQTCRQLRRKAGGRT